MNLSALLVRQPLRRKLLLVMMATTSAALVLAAAAVSTYQWFSLAEVARGEVRTQAGILAANLEAALAFGDAGHARRTLEVLQTRPEFELACLFNEDSQFFAGHTNGDHPAGFAWPVAAASEVRGAAGGLAIYQPVMHDHARIGTLYLRARLAPGQGRFPRYLGVVALVTAACLWLSFLLASRLQRVVSEPILHLVGTTGEVRERRDYSLRAAAASPDEVGSLARSFNAMLGEIQARDDELRRSREDLERRVAGRTAELERENQQRRRFEAALADEKERLAVTLCSIGEAVVATDNAGRIVVFNPVAARLTGWTAEEACGRLASEVLHLLHVSTGQRRENPVAAVLSSRAPLEQSGDLALVSREGVGRLVSLSGAPMTDPGGIVLGVVLVVRDITEKERTAQDVFRTRELESISLLAGGLAHDFNNILTVILGNLSLARMLGKLPAEVSDALLEAERATTHASDLTRQLLTFSKGGAPVRQTASLGEMVRESASFVLHGSNVAAEIVIAPDLWPAQLDVGQIGQVIHHLVLNAMQAMPKGGTLHLRAANETLDAFASPVVQPGRFVTLTVRDSGDGILPEHLNRVFDPYFTTKKQGGGLALATSYAIVRRHEGDITVQSEPGRGSVFRVLLPAVPVGGSSPAKPPAAAPVPASAGGVPGRGRLLVMDDEPASRDLACRLLQPLGYEVVTSDEGGRAIALYTEARTAGRPFDAVVLDLTIPGGVGAMEALRRMREIEPAVRAIVSSGYAADPIMVEHRRHGFAGMVAKPYVLRDLSEALKNVLAGV